MNKNLLNVSSLALRQFKNILKDTGKKAIFFDINSGGCNGFEYRLKPVDNIENEKNVYKEKEISIEICDKSLFYVMGTEIDWKEDIMGRTFVFKNPMAQSSCGCGSSFNPK
jgi:iron-sulfur cluster assembly accessory protein